MAEQVADDLTNNSQMTSLVSFVGTYMRVITHALFRYEGTCFYHNPEERILGLTDVKFFGNESRGKDNMVEILPVETDYDTVLLRSSHIKELQLISLQDIPSTSSLPDDHFTIESVNIPPLTTSPISQLTNVMSDIVSRLDSLLQGISPPLTTSPLSQITNVMSDIVSRLDALLQGISVNTAESLWSDEFWTPISPSATQCPSLRELDQIYLQKIKNSPGVPSHQLDKEGSEKKKKKSIMGPSPKLYMSAIKSLENAASSERRKTQEKRQQLSRSLSEKEKDDTLNSLSVDLGAARVELMSSEETRAPAEEVGDYPRRSSGRGNPLRRVQGEVGTHYGERSKAPKGHAKAYWVQKDK